MLGFTGGAYKREYGIYPNKESWSVERSVVPLRSHQVSFGKLEVVTSRRGFRNVQCSQVVVVEAGRERGRCRNLSNRKFEKAEVLVMRKLTNRRACL